ncbi:hypothetical protein GCM10027341_33250 [Spirosoma knui]
MKSLLKTLRTGNTVLYWFGVICLIGAAICGILVLLTTQQVMGINAFIKPTKFFVSIWLFCWTMALYLPLLNRPRTATIYAWMVGLVLTFEMVVIVGQAALGKLSHFNISSIRDAILFSAMGIAITTFTLWTGYIGVLFFTLKTSAVPASYLWGIRLGILLFVVFAFEGGMMASRLAHTVGAPDGGAGLPVTNWSVRNGDLRVAHFFGMHALQLLPLYGYYLARRPRQVLIAACLYAAVVTGLLVQALSGRPLLLSFGA